MCMYRALTWLLVLLLAWPTALTAQQGGQSASTVQGYAYTQEQLDQLLAPIALYPDTLLSQILMASTYPLDVVEEDRWLKRNSNLTGDRLDARAASCSVPKNLSASQAKRTVFAGRRKGGNRALWGHW